MVVAALATGAQPDLSCSTRFVLRLLLLLLLLYCQCCECCCDCWGFSFVVFFDNGNLSRVVEGRSLPLWGSVAV